MARWGDLGYNTHYSRNDEIEIEREAENEFNAFFYEVGEKFRLVENYGLIEDINANNCYGVEDVYNGLGEWN